MEDKKGSEKIFRNNNKTSNKMALLNIHLSIITLNVTRGWGLRRALVMMDTR